MDAIEIDVEAGMAAGAPAAAGSRSASCKRCLSNGGADRLSRGVSHRGPGDLAPAATWPRSATSPAMQRGASIVSDTGKGGRAGKTSSFGSGMMAILRAPSYNPFAVPSAIGPVTGIPVTEAVVGSPASGNPHRHRRRRRHASPAKVGATPDVEAADVDGKESGAHRHRHRHRHRSRAPVEPVVPAIGETLGEASVLSASGKDGVGSAHRHRHRSRHRHTDSTPSPHPRGANGEAIANGYAATPGAAPATGGSAVDKEGSRRRRRKHSPDRVSPERAEPASGVDGGGGDERESPEDRAARRASALAAGEASPGGAVLHPGIEPGRRRKHKSTHHGTSEAPPTRLRRSGSSGLGTIDPIEMSAPASANGVGGEERRRHKHRSGRPPADAPAARVDLLSA